MEKINATFLGAPARDVGLPKPASRDWKPNPINRTSMRTPFRAPKTKKEEKINATPFSFFSGRTLGGVSTH